MPSEMNIWIGLYLCHRTLKTGHRNHGDGTQGHCKGDADHRNDTG